LSTWTFDTGDPELRPASLLGYDAPRVDDPPRIGEPVRRAVVAVDFAHCADRSALSVQTADRPVGAQAVRGPDESGSVGRGDELLDHAASRYAEIMDLEAELKEEKAA